MKSFRVKAFTIMEMTVAMLIASLVIGITYSAYLIVIGSYHSFIKKNNEMAIVMRLDELLKKDFNHADVILKQKNGLLIEIPGKQINYEIYPELIVRTDAVADTFRVKTVTLLTSFESLPISEIADDPEKSRIDDVSFDLLYENEKIPYHYHKHYSSVNLLQRYPDAFN